MIIRFEGEPQKYCIDEDGVIQASDDKKTSLCYIATRPSIPVLVHTVK
jgi:hypothetical protein